MLSDPPDSASPVLEPLVCVSTHALKMYSFNGFEMSSELTQFFMYAQANGSSFLWHLLSFLSPHLIFRIRLNFGFLKNLFVFLYCLKLSHIHFLYPFKSNVVNDHLSCNVYIFFLLYFTCTGWTYLIKTCSCLKC